MSLTESTTSEMPLANRRVVFVGKLGSMNRKEARELVRKHGGVTLDKIDSTVNVVVIGADQLSSDPHDQLLDDWVIDAASTQQVDVISETDLWQRLGFVEPELEVGRLYTPAMLADLLELPIATIRRWHRRGLICPTRQVHKLAYFDFQEVAAARRLARLIDSGADPKRIEARLSRLASLYPDLQRPLSQLSVIVEGQQVLLRQGEGLVEPGGQMRIDFDSPDAAKTDCDEADRPQTTLRLHHGTGAANEFDEPNLRITDSLATPADFVDLAIEYEDEGQIAMAIDTYRSLALGFGATADICFRIAELLYQTGDYSGARERYFMAVELDETFVEARANLGCVLMELNELEPAIAAFEGALLHHGDYPDAHYHLARALDQVDRSAEATPHWQQFLDLAPKSHWAEEARQRLTQQ